MCALECYQCIADSNSHPCGDEDFSSETTVTEVVPSMECKYCFKTKGKNDGDDFYAFKAVFLHPFVNNYKVYHYLNTESLNEKKTQIKDKHIFV